MDAASGHLTWNQLRRMVTLLASRLARENEPGDVGMLCCPNTCDFWVAFLATLKAGLNVFPISPDIPKVEMISAAERSGAKVFVGPAQAAAWLGERVRSCLELSHVCLPDDCGRAGRDTEEQDSTLGQRSELGGLLLQSSGTTDTPKIVYRTAPSLDRVSRNMCAAIGVGPDDCVLATVPLCHSYGVEHGLLVPLWAGCEVRLMRNLDMHVILQQLQTGGITVLPSVPVGLEMISRLSEPGTRFPSLRAAYSAGAPLPPEIYGAMLTRCGVRVAQLYGATEIGSITYNHPAQEPFDPRSVGRPMDGVVLRIQDPEDTQASAAPGTEGPLLVACPSMMAGYWGESASGLREGYWDTGDLARIDASGNLTITGRAKLMIDIGGKKVNPVEVENVLLEHPDVGDACVVPLRLTPTLCRLRAVIAARVPGGSVDEEDLRRHCRERLAPHKVPRVFEVRPALPRTPHGKIQRRLLEEA